MVFNRIIVADDEAVQRKGLAAIIQRILPESRVFMCINGVEVMKLLEDP